MRALELSAPFVLVFLASACGQPAAPVVPPGVPPAAPPPSEATAPAAARAGIPMLSAPPAPMGADRVAFKLYKFLGETGAERDTFVALPGGGTEAKALYSYRDRNSMVPLAATFDFAPDGALRRYRAWGKTSRFTTIDDRVEARDDGAIEVAREGGSVTRVARPDGVVVASGYAPMLAQDLMLRAWNQRGRPAKIPLLPEGEVWIESRGKETYNRGADKVTLEHVAVSGLVWGREDAWLDDKGALAAVITRDAEFDHSEATREGFDSILPELAKSTGADGAAWLAKAAKGAQRSAPGVLALVGGNLIDGAGGPPVKDAVVVLEGDRIAAVGPRGKVTIPAGAATIDVTGKSIVPGLWDMHAHVEQVEQGAAYLASGVTTVRDMGNILDFITGVRDAIDEGKGLGPRVLVDGLVDGAGPASLGTVKITTQAEIGPTIDRLKKAGCLEVKIYSSVSPSLVKPIVAYAHAHGMRAVGHVPEGMTTEQAIDAGYDSISHIHYLVDPVLPTAALRQLSRVEGYKREAAIDLASPPMARELASLAAHHVVIDDTIALEEQLTHTLEENAKREPGIATLPRELEATLSGVPASVATEADAAFERSIALLGELHKRGILVVAGTDITVPGHSVHRELELYVKAGFSPMEALQAATIVPARVMHLDKELGTVAVGKRADLVILNGDPLADVSNVRKTSLVIVRGRAYDPKALWRLVGFKPVDRDAGSP